MSRPLSGIDAVNATHGCSPSQILEKFTPEEMASALHLLHRWHKGDQERRDKRSCANYAKTQHLEGKYSTLRHENNKLRKQLYPTKS